MIDVDAILAAAPAAEPPNAPTSAAPRADAPAGNRRAAMALALGSAWPAKGRHEAQLALAGALRAEGFTEAEAVEFLCTVCRAAGNEDRAKREATVRHTWSKPDGAALTGWTRLKQHVDAVVVDAARGALARGADWNEATTRRLAAAASGAGMLPNVGTSSQLTTEGETKISAGRFTFDNGGLDADLPAIDYQVDGLIARGDIVMMVAHGNSLKTWLSFSMAHAIASGRPWLGKFQTTRGRAVLLDFESGKYEVKRRLKLLGVCDGDVSDRLLRTSYPPAQLVDPEAWIELAALKPDFIVVDSFNAASPGDTNENEAQAAEMLKIAGRFAEATGCTVIFIHHARKGSGGDRREAVRGSTALFAACDRIFEFTDLEKSDDGTIQTTITSVKDGAGRRPIDVRVELSDRGLRFVEAEAKPKESPSLPANKSSVIAILKSHPMGVAKQDLADMLLGKTETKRQLLATLLVGGTLVEIKQGRKLIVLLNPSVEH